MKKIIINATPKALKRHRHLLAGCAAILLFNGIIGAANAQTTTSIDVVPVPAKIKMNAGQFVINDKTRLVLVPENNEMKYAVGVLNRRFRQAANFMLKTETTPTNTNEIVCKLNPAITNVEGYKLSVQPTRIVVEAQTPQGIFYAMQTIRQLLPFQIERPFASNVSWTVPCVEIEDAPRFKHRGLHLDVARHFMPKEFVKRFIDMLAYHKMNTFHWHLTEDQGWRIEIKKYPKLTEVGAYRNRTLDGKYVSADKRKWKNERYGGFYTQDDIKEVVAYAQRQFITIIPEIEMPGHALAALASYPELGCTGGPYEVEGLWGVFNDIFCPSDKTFDFLENVLAEVMDLFPSEYIHIGGDEAPKVRWKNSTLAQDLMKKEGLKDEHELQSYFIKRIEKFVESKGRHIIGWDEILEGGLAPNATVMSWRGEDGGIAAAKQRHDVIMSPNSHCYLDFYQANPKNEPLAIGGFLPLWKVYSYNPVPASLTADEAKHIRGVQGNIWTEYISTTDHAEYMAFPRGAAIAEVGWSPLEKKNYVDFKARILRQFKRYDGIGWNYCKAVQTEVE
jgi:hexosaminidase